MFLFRKKKKQSDVNAKAKLEPTAAPAEELVPEALIGPGVTAPPMPIGPDGRPRRKKRKQASSNKTRLMGFDTSDGRAELFDEEGAETAVTGRCQFPVGFVFVTHGPGLGESFAIRAGMSQIGRGEDQAIRLDFGDQAISRTNHAAIVYDPKEHTYLLGHGGKANIVRLNGTPVVSTSDLKDGDEIELGETRLRFVGICSNDFNWEIAQLEDEGSDDDVEIA
ncbi:MAG: FHA domain-containing protein [Silicimonas sp.]|nr:FHA domain-containing protein [Silicimonas sp.]